MSELPVIVQLLLALPLLIGWVLIASAPQLLGSWAEAKRDDHERQMAQQAELERKLAIAEAAIAARARGEPFVPPADYDR